jgi:hypothetical protein
VSDKHTLGPWTIRYGGGTEGFTIAGNGRSGIVCECYLPCGHDEFAPANARLIAAAPDLLAAAKRALNVLKAQGESVRPGNALGALSAAIDKAERASAAAGGPHA